MYQGRVFLLRKVLIVLSLFCSLQIWAKETCGPFLASGSYLAPLAFGPQNFVRNSTEPVLRLEPPGVFAFNPKRYEELKNLLAPFLLSQERVVIETLSSREAKSLKDYLQSQEDFSGTLMFAIPEKADPKVLYPQIIRTLENNDRVYFFAVRDQLDWSEFVDLQEHIRFYGHGEEPEVLSPERTSALLQNLFFESVDEYMDWANSLERPLNIPLEVKTLAELQGRVSTTYVEPPKDQKQRQEQKPEPEQADDKPQNDKHDTKMALSKSSGSAHNVQPSSMISLEDAISLMRILEIRNESQFRLWRESGLRPVNFPSNPDKHYAGRGWISWTHFFGSHILTYEEHEALVQQRGVKTLQAYLELVEKRDYEGRLSRAPNVHFKSKGWVSWNKFFNISEDPFMSFFDAMLLMKKLGIQSTTQFMQWRSSGHRPKNFPSNPNLFYSEKGWKGWSHFFSNHFLSLQEHIELVRSRKIKSIEEYHALVAKNDFVGRLYKNPNEEFRGAGGWVSWEHFFGPQMHYLSLDRLRLAVKRLNIKSEQAYLRARRANPQIAKTFPLEPDKFYEAWIGWDNLFNGKVLVRDCVPDDTSCNSGDYFSFAEANLVLRLYEIDTDEKLQEWLESPQRPKRFPQNPEQYYGDEWVSLNH